MNKLLGFAAAGLVAAFATSAMAQTDGWYVGAQGGANWVPNMSASATGIASGKLETKPGYALLGNVGYGFGQFRLEGELGWRDNNAKSDTLGGATTGNSGHYGALDLMANGIYNIPTGTPFSPYLGAGIGAVDLTDHISTAAGGSLVSHSDWVFGYQGIAGLDYNINPNLALTADYRYLRTLQASFAEVGGGTLKDTYASHAVLVGFTYKFGAPPPPPAPMVAAAPPPPPPPAQTHTEVQHVTKAPAPKNYLVFFDFDKSNISDDAQKIIQTAVTNFKNNNGAVIHLTGHTDTVGTEQYNMALSLRRANAVKAALTTLGIPDSEITVVGKGKTDLLVPTADGVREPQNRRVEIVID